MQCDAAVTDVDPHHLLYAISEDYLENRHQVKGLGGTDFRPVFTYVDEALATGELERPWAASSTSPTVRAPTPRAAAALRNRLRVPRFRRCRRLEPPVPPWAMKVILDETFVQRGQLTCPSAHPVETRETL